MLEGDRTCNGRNGLVTVTEGSDNGQSWTGVSEPQFWGVFGAFFYHLLVKFLVFRRASSLKIQKKSRSCPAVGPERSSKRVFSGH